MGHLSESYTSDHSDRKPGPKWSLCGFMNPGGGRVYRDYAVSQEREWKYEKWKRAVKKNPEVLSESPAAMSTEEKEVTFPILCHLKLSS